MPEDNYVTIPLEIPITKEPIEFSTINNKNQRIRLALNYIERNYNEAQLVENGFLGIDTASNITKPPKPTNKPDFCRGPGIFDCNDLEFIKENNNIFF